ncbi:NAD(P)/FAD-dependent oxidoreductase [Halodesulfurarchaeum sp.]|uniref:NAD(P)/FAD-dependent oxidoreductase n=1 Tax=Halodesulfurarchaeum sp. TaxID=1980530 RepID=UPI002FC31A23
MAETSVAVIGAGLAGLETARQLARAGPDVDVYEAEPSVGGRVQTDTEAGYTIDRGFQVLFTSYPEAKRALDFAALDLKRFPAGAIVCRPNHRSVVADPLRDPFRAIETAFSRDLTVGDKLEVLRLRLALKGKSREDVYSGTDETIVSYLRDKGFSDRFIESFAAPFYGGITLDRSLKTSSRVFQFTFRMLTEGVAAIPETGMQAIPRQLARRARNHGATIHTDTRVEGIAGTGPVTIDLAGETVSAKTVVVAAGPEESHRLTGIGSIPTTGRSVRTQYFEVPAPNPIANQPRIHLNAVGQTPNQVVNLSAVAPSYAVGDRALLAASTPGTTDETPDSDAAKTQETIASWYPAASFDDLKLVETVDVPFAQYAQPPGIHETLPEVSEPEGAIYFAGDFTTDSSINGAFRSGRLAAEAIQQSDP